MGPRNHGSRAGCSDLEAFWGNVRGRAGPLPYGHGSVGSLARKLFPVEMEVAQVTQDREGDFLLMEPFVREFA